MKGCIKFKDISELPNEVGEKLYNLRLPDDRYKQKDEYLKIFDTIVVEDCMYHSDTDYAQGIVRMYKIAEEKHRVFSLQTLPMVIIKGGRVIKNRYGYTEPPKVKPKPVYVIEAILAPGYWEIANDLYYTNEESAEADKKSLEEGIRKYKKNTDYRIKKLENGDIEA